MQCIQSKTNDIFFNLAAEEFLLKNKSDDYLMLWQSKPAVVIGKHQNAFAEFNYPYTEKEKIVIARRLSGGGTVFHDEGNINFTYIVNGEKNKLVDFKKFVTPIINFLHQNRVAVEMGSKNELLIEGKKISGNAEHIYRSRVLHHGTLLYNSDLTALHESLRVKTGRFIDKAIQSNRSVITNLISYFDEKWTAKEFMNKLLVFLVNYYGNIAMYDLTEYDLKEIEKLKKEKYLSWNWIFGYSPDFEVISNLHWRNADYRIHLKISRGIVVFSEVREKISDKDGRELKTIMSCLLNCRFIPMEIKNSFLEKNASNDIIEQMIEILFH